MYSALFNYFNLFLLYFLPSAFISLLVVQSCHNIVLMKQHGAHAKLLLNSEIPFTFLDTNARFHYPRILSYIR